uniref:protein unc-93 homolog A-like isoform X2 n=1 Tax=Styela clava TaxID=7725 RepID=UPI001939C4F1|nr:protein unc-93 homolog A-like isoform X2 [Styela clava]
MDSDNIINKDEAEPTSVDHNLKHKNIRKIAFQFYAFALGCLLCQGTTMSVSSLQSSINIQQSIGTKTLGSSKLASVLAGLFCTPLLIRKLGYKWALVLGEAIAIIFVAANFYPAPYVMIPVGILHGIGSSLVWTILPIYNLIFGQLHGSYGRKHYDYYGRKYTSQFYAILRSGRIFASIISYGVLYGTRQELPKESATKNGTDSSIETLLGGKYENCGANDCQDPNVTISTLDKYVPPNALSIYLLMGTFCVINVFAVVVHAKFLVNVKVTDKILVSDGMPTKNGNDDVVKSKVGLVLIAHDLSYILASLVSGKIIGFLGRNFTIAFAMALDISNYLFCKFWQANENTTGLVYLAFVGFGASDALWKNCSVSIYSDYFRKEREISFSVRNVCITIGVTVGYLWSPLLCVGVKIYIQLILLIVSILAYGFAEFIYKKERITNIESSDDTGNEKTKDIL